MSTLRDRRKAAGYHTQAALAAKLGVPRSVIALLESDHLSNVRKRVEALLG